jgi:hypothetical protein
MIHTGRIFSGNPLQIGPNPLHFSEKRPDFSTKPKSLWILSRTPIQRNPGAADAAAAKIAFPAASGSAGRLDGAPRRCPFGARKDHATEITCISGSPLPPAHHSGY